ncbi:MAG TPA: FHA domain-containing protein [Trebonia sp.]
MLISASPDAPVVAEIWRRMTAGSRLDGLVSGFLQFGFEHLPDFALLIEAGDRYHALCRGDGSVSLGVQSGGVAHVNGAGSATWLDYPVPLDVSTIVLGDPPVETGLLLPAAAGIFLASGVIVDLASLPDGQRTGTGPLMTSAAPSGPTPSGTAGPTLSVAASAAPGPYELRPEPPRPADPPVPAVPQQDVPDDRAYDFLFAATQMRTVEDAAIRPEADEPLFSLAPLAPPVPLAPSVPLAPPVPLAPDAAGRGGPASPGLIESVPWAIPERPPASASGPPPSPDRDAMIPAMPNAGTAVNAGPAEDTAPTVKRGDLPGAGPDLMVPDQLGPTVHALMCQRSHVSPTGSVTCRVCGEPLPPQEPVIVSRPVLGALRLSTGDVISLERGVVLGRNPRTEFDGDERLHAVKLPGGDGDISRTHLKVTLDGWHVLVTDLNSTNGTLVELPGRQPERLRPSDPFAIPDGTVVTLADGIYFRYEAAQ